MRQLTERNRTALEVRRLWPDPNAGTCLTLTRLSRADDQGFNDIALGKDQPGDLSFTVTGHFQASRQGVGHADADTMQTTREAVGAALALIKLAARVQTRKDQLNNRRLFFWVHAKRNTPSVVLYRDRPICVQHHFDPLAMACQRFIGRVIQHLLDDVQGVVRAGVHTRALFDRLKSF